MLNKIEGYELMIHNEKGEFTFHDLQKFTLKGDIVKGDFISWLSNEVDKDNTVSIGTRGYRLNRLKFLFSCYTGLRISDWNSPDKPDGK